MGSKAVVTCEEAEVEVSKEEVRRRELGEDEASVKDPERSRERCR
jgi:hypothetical protein